MQAKLVILAMGLWLQGQEPETFPVNINRLVYQIGDQPQWRDASVTDPGWQAYRGFDPVLAGAQYWLRGEVRLPERDHLLQPLSLRISATAAYEVWWDGRLIGRSGSVGADRGSEVPGLLDNAFPIPAELATAGLHQLSLRVSTHYKSKREAGYLFVMDVVQPGKIHAKDFKSFQRLPVLGVVLLVAAFYLLTYFTDDRRSDTLWFGLLCLGVAAMIVAESWRELFGYLYAYHALRLYAVLGLTALNAFLLTGFLSHRFFPRQWRSWSLLQGLMILGGYAYSITFDGKSMAIMFGTLVLATVLISRAAVQRQRGSWIALSGILFCLALMMWNRYAFMDQYFFLAFGGLLMVLMIAQALELRARAQAKRDALLTAARLEIELLKKNIQPHFLLNTLTSLMEWLEEAPSTGAKLVQALAEELRLLGEVASLPEIPWKQELALCRAHLKVMGYRRDLRFNLEVEGIDPERTVPPALIHTLVENGVTYHGGASDHNFRLRCEPLPNGVRYRFTAPTTSSDPAERTGTGIRYIKVRLQERYPDRWSFQHGPVAGAWQTLIEIRED